MARINPRPSEFLDFMFFSIFLFIGPDAAEAPVDSVDSLARVFSKNSHALKRVIDQQ